MTIGEVNACLGHEIQVYTGDLVDGNRHGYGVGKWPDGKLYVGQWQNGVRHGQGCMTWPTGQKYTGEWHEDMAIGKAVLTKSDGAVYAGDFLDSQRHGLGIQTYANGAVYAGGWKDDRPEGWAVIRTAQGRQLIGRLGINQRHGRGVQFFENGENDDNNRIYWEGGEFICQAEWFNREQTDAFIEESQQMGIPFCNDDKLAQQEKIFILTEFVDDSILELPGMFELAMMSTAYVFKSGIMNADISSSDELKSLFGEDTSGLDSFCEERELSVITRKRLELWAEWSKSEEKARIENFLKGGSFERRNEGFALKDSI